MPAAGGLKIQKRKSKSDLKGKLSMLKHQFVSHLPSLYFADSVSHLESPEAGVGRVCVCVCVCRGGRGGGCLFFLFQ